MKIDLSKYAVNKAPAQRWYKEKGHQAPDGAVSNMGIIYMVPCIVAAYWIGEIVNWTPEIRKSIESLTKFYHYEEILNKPEGCPEGV